MKISGAKGLENIPIIFKILITCLCGTGVLWFSQVLWVNSLILYYIRKYEKDKLYNKLNDFSIIANNIFKINNKN